MKTINRNNTRSTQKKSAILDGFVIVDRNTNQIVYFGSRRACREILPHLRDERPNSNLSSPIRVTSKVSLNG